MDPDLTTGPEGERADDPRPADPRPDDPRPDDLPPQGGAREDALTWLRHLSPLLDDPASLTAAERDARLERLPALREDGPATLAALKTALEDGAGPDDADLLKTLREAVEQLDLLEGDLKRGTGGHWSSDRAGDEDEEVDPARIRERLAAAAARREVEELSGGGDGPRLRLKIPPGSQGAAVYLGVMAVAATVLATLNIKYIFPLLVHLFGSWAYAWIPIYVAGYLASLAMARTGLLILATEQIDLEGPQLTLRRHLGDWWSSCQRMTLTPESHAVVTEAARASSQSAWSPRTASVEICDAAGKVLHVAYGRPQSQQERLVQRLNDHIAGLPGEPDLD